VIKTVRQKHIFQTYQTQCIQKNNTGFNVSPT